MSLPVVQAVELSEEPKFIDAVYLQPEAEERDHSVTSIETQDLEELKYRLTNFIQIQLEDERKGQDFTRSELEAERRHHDFTRSELEAVRRAYDFTRSELEAVRRAHDFTRSEMRPKKVNVAHLVRKFEDLGQLSSSSEETVSLPAEPVRRDRLSLRMLHNPLYDQKLLEIIN